MKIWIDDIRPAPQGYLWTKSVKYARDLIEFYIKKNDLEVIDIDHDAGEYNDAAWGGDYINVLKWLERKQFNYPIKIHIHSMNPVGVQNMRAIIEHNGWEEIK